MEALLPYVAFAVAGLFVGIVSGMLGIGGGMLMIPLFRLVFGLSAIESAATSLFTMVFTSVSGTLTHLKNGNCDLKLGCAMGLGGCVTSSLGVYLASVSPSWAIMAIAAIVIAYSAATMLRKALGTQGKRKASDAETGQEAAETTSAKRFAVGFAIGLVAGLFAGYIGVGGGFIMVPMMVSFLNMPMHKASSTSLVSILILAIPGVIGQMYLGNVAYLSGILMAAGTVPGAVLGAMFSKRVPERALRFLFSGLLAVAAVMLVVNELGIL